MWLLLLAILLAAAIFSLTPAGGRRAAGYTLAAIVGAIVLYALSDLTRSLLEVKRSQDASKLIATADITIDDLHLSGSTPATYEMRGVLHNRSPTYVLRLVRFTFVVEDCIGPTACEESLQGHAEVIREVDPNQSAVFSTRTIFVEGDRALAPPRGERRIPTKVWLTSARMPAR